MSIDMPTPSFLLDGEPVPFVAGQSIKAAAQAAGHYIPHLCWHPDLTAHGSCKLCTIKIGGRFLTSSPP
jgi:[NiFe] hydrogenase diaphorase moiety small subunit